MMCKPGSVGDLGGQPPRSTRPGLRLCPKRRTDTGLRPRHRITPDTGLRRITPKDELTPDYADTGLRPTPDYARDTGLRPTPDHAGLRQKMN